jgi:transposase
MGKHSTRFVGMDVHARTIAIAVADGEGVRSVGVIPNRPDTLRRIMKRLGPPATLRACYEAGPCGYGIYRELVAMGIHCDVIAPTLIPKKAGDRVKTDRRDAERLARCYRSGDLTPIWIPGLDHEALRDLLRAREAAKKDQLRARHRLQKFLLRQGRLTPDGMKTWTLRHVEWVRGQEFEHPGHRATFQDYMHEVDHAMDRISRLEAAIDDVLPSMPPEVAAVVAGLQALRGIAQLSAATIVAEVGPLSRFEHPRKLMGYSGTVSSEHSSGGSTWRGPITKAGNAHLRRAVVEAAWHYQHAPALSRRLVRRQAGLDGEVKEIAWKAQCRLSARFRKLTAKGKPRQKAVTAVARELLGFIWSIGTHIERKRPALPAAA